MTVQHIFNQKQQTLRETDFYKNITQAPQLFIFYDSVCNCKKTFPYPREHRLRCYISLPILTAL